MAFQQILKQGGTAMLSETIRINRTIIVFSDDIIEEITKKGEHYFSIFVDEDANKLAFKSAKEPKGNFIFSKERKGIVRTNFLRNQMKMIDGNYKTTKDLEGKWIIENCFEKEKGKKGNGILHKKIEADEVSVVNSGFFFPESVSSHPLMKGKERMERIYKENKTNHDLLLFKPTLNKIDGKKLTKGTGGTLYFFANTKEYLVGRYKFTVTNEGFLVKVLKQ